MSKPVDYTHEELAEAEAQLPESVKLAMHLKGWNALGVYEAVRDTLKIPDRIAELEIYRQGFIQKGCEVAELKADFRRMETESTNHFLHSEVLQAQIDALMQEYCPDEMTEAQRTNWAKHQKPVLKEQSND